MAEMTEVAKGVATHQRLVALLTQENARYRVVCNAANNFGLIHNQFRIAILAILDPELSAFFAKH